MIFKKFNLGDNIVFEFGLVGFYYLKGPAHWLSPFFSILGPGIQFSASYENTFKKISLQFIKNKISLLWFVLNPKFHLEKMCGSHCILPQIQNFQQEGNYDIFSNQEEIVSQRMFGRVIHLIHWEILPKYFVCVRRYHCLSKPPGFWGEERKWAH